MSAGGAEEVADQSVLMAAIVWTVPTIFVLLFNALFFEIMQGIVAFSLFVLPTAVLWVQAIVQIMRRAKGRRP